MKKHCKGAQWKKGRLIGGSGAGEWAKKVLSE